MASDWFMQALELQARGAHAEVLDVCAQAPSGSRARFAAHVVCALSLAALGRRAEAVNELRKAQALGAPSRRLCQLAIDACRALHEPELGRNFVDAALDAFGVKLNGLLEQREKFVKDLGHLAGLAGQAERVVKFLPRSVKARRTLASIYTRHHVYELAVAELEAALELDSTSFNTWCDTVAAYLELGDTMYALRALDRMHGLAANPEEVLRLSDLHFRAGSFETAFRLADELRSAEPRLSSAGVLCARYALFRGEAEAARAQLHRLDPSEGSAEREWANLAFVEGRYVDALEHTALAWTWKGSDVEVSLIAAAAHLRLSRFDAAREALSAVLLLREPWHPAGDLLFVSIQIEIADKLPGWQMLETFSTFAPVFGSAHEALDLSGDVVTQPLREPVREAVNRLSGNFSRAQTYLHGPGRAIRRLSHALPARTACVRAVAAIDVRPWSFVIDRVLALEALYPKSPLVRTHAAELHLWLGDYARCEAECRKALAITETEDSRWARVGLGAALMFQEREQEALEVFARSADLMKPGAPLQAYRGETLRRLGRLDAARAELQASLNEVPSRTSAWIQLALIAHAQGDADAARQTLERLRDRLPELVKGVERDLRVTGSDTQDPTVVLEATLTAMRGNRSSGRITYFLTDGHARSVQGCALD